MRTAVGTRNAARRNPPRPAEPRSDPAVDRRAALAAGAVGVAVLALTAAVLVPWDWLPGGTLRVPEAGEVFTDAQIARAESYSSFARPMSWGVTLLGVLLLAALGFTGVGSRWHRRLLGGARWWVAVPVGVLALLVAGTLLTLPLALLLRQRRLEEQLTRQGLAGFLGDRGLSVLISWVTLTLTVLIVIGAARRFPRRWFLPAGAAVAALVFAGSFLYPVLVTPLFNNTTSMPDGPLRTSLLQIAADEGVPVDEILVSDASRRTTTLNASVSGLGGTRSLVVYDTLLDDLAAPEVRSVVAHEVAHVRHRDVLLGTTIGALGAGVGMVALAGLLDSPRVRRRAGVTGPSDAAAVPLLLAVLAVATLLAAPLQGTVSQAMEARADRAAVAATGDPDSFIRLQHQLAVRSLADPTPPRWSQLLRGTHPTVLQRIGLAQSLRDEVEPPVRPAPDRP